MFPTVEAMVYGQRQDLMILHTIVQIKEYLSGYHLLLRRGILLRVIAAAMAVCHMVARTATIGLLLLARATRTACASTAMAMSIRPTPTLARAVGLSVV